MGPTYTLEGGGGVIGPTKGIRFAFTLHTNIHVKPGIQVRQNAI